MYPIPAPTTIERRPLRPVIPNRIIAPDILLHFKSVYPTTYIDLWTEDTTIMSQQIQRFYLHHHRHVFILISIFTIVMNSRVKPQRTVGGKACSSTKGGLLYPQHLLDSQSLEFEICILQALNMPLIRCTFFFQERLSRHITFPSEKTRPESWPGDNMGKATPFWQLSSSHRYLQM